MFIHYLYASRINEKKNIGKIDCLDRLPEDIQRIVHRFMYDFVISELKREIEWHDLESQQMYKEEDYEDYDDY